MTDYHSTVPQTQDEDPGGALVQFLIGTSIAASLIFAPMVVMLPIDAVVDTEPVAEHITTKQL